LFKGYFKYYSAAIAAAVIWGFFAIPLRALKPYPSELILHYRILSSLFITWAIILLFRRRKLREDLTYINTTGTATRRNIVNLILLAGVLITGNWYSFIYAINNISLKSAAFAYMICPLITAFGGSIFLKEHLSITKAVGMGIAILSIFILSRGSQTDVLWSVFIASQYAFYLIIQRVIGKIDKLTMLGFQLIISAILMAPLFVYHRYGLPSEASFWVNTIVIATVFTIAPLYLSLYALTGIPSSSVGIIIYVNPIIAFSVAIFYFDEHVNYSQIAAYSLLFLAVIVFNWTIINEGFAKRSKLNLS